MHTWGRAAIGCRPDAADAEHDLLTPAKCLIVHVDIACTYCIDVFHFEEITKELLLNI